jgi:tungstate transport system ATP-binding protein
MQKSVESGARCGTTQGSCVLPISASALRVTRGGRLILSSVGFDCPKVAATTVLLGPNGAGKSLLMRVLAGLTRADSGQLSWAGTPPDRTRIGRIGFVFQRPVLLHRSAFANIDYALKVTGVAREDRPALVEVALSAAGLAHLSEQPARSLSAGEQQRLSLARAIACRPELLMLDEPTANLDPASTAAFERNLQDIRARGTPILLITHDLGQARRLAERIAFMHQGQICETTPAADFFTKPRSREAAAFIRGEIVI